MNVCPDCRAGRRFIERENVSEGLRSVKVEYECLRCGYTTTKRVPYAEG